MTDIFESSKLLIARAKHHVSDFERQANEFYATNPYKMVVVLNVNTIERIHKFKLVKPIPVTLPYIAFDALNELRSALDNAIFALEFGKGKGDTAFPIASDVTNFENSGVKGRCKNLPPEIVDVIRSFKPYKGGNDLLYALNKACNANKHAIVRPYAMAPSGIDFSNARFSPGIRTFPLVWDRTKNEMKIFSQKAWGTAQVDLQIHTFIAICDVEIVDGHPALGVLNEFVRIVESVVMALEAESRRLNLI